MKLFERRRIQRPIDRLIAAGAPAGNDRDLTALKRRPQRAIEYLFERLQATDERETLRRIQYLLFLLLDNTTVEAVSAALKSDDRKAARAAYNVLKRSTRYNPNKLLPLLADETAPHVAVLELLRTQRDRINAGELLAAVADLPASHLRTALALVVEVADPGLGPYLVDRLQSDNVALRAQVAAQLHHFPSKQVVRALEQALADRATDVRFNALDSLRRIGSGVDLEAVIPLLADTNIGVQTLAIETVAAHHRDERTLALLLPLLRDPSAYVRRAAVEVLNVVADQALLDQLIQALQDEDWWSRQRAADALAKIGGPRVARTMLRLMRSPDEVMRRMAIEVINTTRDTRAFDDVLAALDDPDWWVRERAIDAIAVMGGEQGLRVLVERLATDEEARPTILRALAVARDPGVLDSVYPWLADGHSMARVEALRAVESLAGEDDAETAMARVEDALTAQTDERSLTEARRVLRSLRIRAGQVVTAAIIENADHTSTTVARPALPAEELRSGQPLDLRALEPGTVFDDRYRLVAWLGSGAFGEVVQFEDMTVDDYIVLKFLNARYARDQETKQRFISELRVARRVTHPNVIRIYDFVQLGGEFAISMEYFDGYPLDREFLQGRGMRAERGLRLLREITFGMEAAHNAGVIHRDLKPGNILMNALGEVKIVDFGIAAAAHGDDERTGSGQRFVGTPAYAAPEQIRDRPVDQRADIYSLGVVAYRMLAGRLPYEARDTREVLKGHLRGDAPALDEVNPEAGSEVAALVRRAMRLDPGERWPSMAALRHELERITG